MPFKDSVNLSLTNSSHPPRMDTDSPRPNCPYCGGGMQFKETSSGFEARSALYNFECRGCRVVLSILPGARVFEMARVPAGTG